MIAAFPAASATVMSMVVVLLAALVLGLPAFDRVVQRGEGRRQALLAGLVLTSGIWGVQAALLSIREIPLTAEHLLTSGTVTAALCCGLCLWYRHHAANRPALPQRR
ncbi:hypothetical protein [Deinococcus sp.]|uniref:hypothetical protein n=1 Tax=Deinococcus sp. TaxID=47478 RepID=UPI0028698146|nr:hypothetical protein [Deinococcus sp.]